MKFYSRRNRFPGTSVMAVIVLLAGAGFASAQDEAARIDAKLVPAQAKDAKAFVPAGWKIEEQLTGDLNGDARPDQVLKLVEDRRDKNDEGMPTERGRALIIAI